VFDQLTFDVIYVQSNQAVTFVLDYKGGIVFEWVWICKDAANGNGYGVIIGDFSYSYKD
jgi:hypothetical protein